MKIKIIREWETVLIDTYIVLSSLLSLLCIKSQYICVHQVCILFLVSIGKQYRIIVNLLEISKMLTRSAISLWYWDRPIFDLFLSISLFC